jgi:hypothetical protein
MKKLCNRRTHRSEKLPKSRRRKNRPFRTGKGGNESNDERAANVHEKGAERKHLTRALSNESRQPESRSTPKCATEHYENITEHKELLPVWKESLAHAVFCPESFGAEGKLHCLSGVYAFLFWINRNVKAPLAATTEHSFISAGLIKLHLEAFA